MNQPRRHQKLEFCTLNFYQITKRIIQQLAKLSDAVQEKRPELANRKGVFFQRDNAKPYTSLVTRQKLFERGWDECVLTAPTLPFQITIHSMQNLLNGKIFNDADDVKSNLIQFFCWQK